MTEHLERLEQVAVHVADLEASMRVYRDLGVRHTPVLDVGIPGESFRFGGSSIGIALVQTEPLGLRAIGFRVHDMAGIKKKLGEHGIEPALEFDAHDYDEKQFDIDNVRFSFAEYRDALPDRATAAVLAGILRAGPPGDSKRSGPNAQERTSGFEHLEALEQVAVHVDDLEKSMAVWQDLGVRFLPIMNTVIGGDAFRLVVSPVGLSLVETQPPGLRAVGFRVHDLPGITAKLGGHGIEPILDFAADGYAETHFMIDDVRFSYAEYPKVRPARPVAAIVGGLVKVPPLA